jgi:hypothetical protein
MLRIYLFTCVDVVRSTTAISRWLAIRSYRRIGPVSSARPLCVELIIMTEIRATCAERI